LHADISAHANLRVKVLDPKERPPMRQERTGANDECGAGNFGESCFLNFFLGLMVLTGERIIFLLP
jgi:hypothetical protein